MGPPAHKSLATSQPPMIGNPMCRLKWSYHPYTLTPQNYRLDEKTQKTTFVCSVYARFGELAGF